jgi:hypothetical protein
MKNTKNLYFTTYNEYKNDNRFLYFMIIVTFIFFILPVIIFLCVTIHSNTQQYQFTYNNIINGEYQFIDSYIDESDSHVKTYTIIYRIDSETIDEFDCSKKDYYTIMNKYVY